MLSSVSCSGGILVFLTGRREIEELCRKLRRKYAKMGTLVDTRAKPDAKPSAGGAKPATTAARKPMSKNETLCMFAPCCLQSAISFKSRSFVYSIMIGLQW